MTQMGDLDHYLRPAFSRKPRSVKVLDVSGLTSYTDILVIMTGTSARQVISIAEHICEQLKKKGKKPLGVEGMKEGKWILLDFGWIIIHLFDTETHELFDLEGLWVDAPRIDIQKIFVESGNTVDDI